MHCNVLKRQIVNWLKLQVGVPAKSGVSGALILVIPNVMGIGLWSPPLDALGNTVRGVQFAKELIKTFNFHRFDNLLKQSKSKTDPRKFRNEHLRQTTLCLLYAATTGDLTALKR
jgi:glutaminase